MASPGSVVIQFLAKADQARRDVLSFAKSLGDVDDEAGTADAALTEVQRGLDRTGSAARDSSTDLGLSETAFDQLADEAQQAAARIRSAGTEMGDGIRDGADDIDTETRRMSTDMADTGREAGAEFIGNIAEGIGSGEASLTDVVQGTLGGITNLAASFTGPLGLAVAGAAAGVGLVFSKVKAESDKAAEQVQNLIDKLSEVGTTSSKAAKQIIWDEWQATMEAMPDQLHKIVGSLETAGIKGETFRDALTGSEKAQTEVNKKLSATGLALIDNYKKGKPLTQDQQDYLQNQTLIRDELKKMGVTLDTVEGVQSDIAYFTGKAADEADTWARNQNDVAEAAGLTETAIRNIPDSKTTTIWVVTKNKNGTSRRPVGSPVTAMAPAPATAAAEPVIVNVYSSGGPTIDSPRALRRLLERGDVRMGRKAGQTRAVAW